MGQGGRANLSDRLRDWASQNMPEPHDYERIDFSGEIDGSLSFDENVSLLREKFPGIFRERANARTAPKQLIMPQWLIAKVETKEKACTYRPKSLNSGESYYLVPNRFQGQSKARVVVRITEVESIEDPADLTDEQARWTGLKDLAELFFWFKKWYSKRYPPDGKAAIRYRNWFVIEELV